MKAKNPAHLMAGLAMTSLLFTACDKRAPMAPERDTEFQSAIDATYALQVISDVDMVCSYACENDLATRKAFFWEAPGSNPQNKVTVSAADHYINVSFNNALCRDGHQRDGTIRIQFNPDLLPNADYYRDYGFWCRVMFIEYKVDGFNVSLRNDLRIKNLAASPTWDPRNTPLSWSINGDFDLKLADGTGKDVHCNLNLVKTLSNTSDPAVFTGKESMINWNKALLAYTGSAFGETGGNVPFKYTIRTGQPIVRDFQCSPEQVSSLTPDERPRSPYQEYHPFVNGVADFSTADRYPRVVYYGAEDGSSAPCDNSGVIMIKGISYPVDFLKDYR